MNTYDIYPLTIVKDRYNGCYSRGEWTAWNCDADEVPPDISDDDVTCACFWDNAHDAVTKSIGIMKYLSYGADFECPVFGVGGGIESAVLDLKKRLEKEEK